MSEQPGTAPPPTRAAINDCWNSIGVRGDGSCPELTQYVHCRNCPVYSAGAAQLLDGDLPASYLAEWTRHFARRKDAKDAETRSVLIFRVASEWLALPTSVVTEVSNLLPIHSLPHRQNRVVLGVASVHGELLVCVSLGQIIGVEPAAAAAPSRDRRGTVYERLLVIGREDVRAICPVDEVHGLHRFHPREVNEVPTTVAKAAVTYATGVLTCDSRSVGLLDDQLLFYTLKRSLA
jgi:chemotaxis-related protein WspD